MTDFIPKDELQEIADNYVNIRTAKAAGMDEVVLKVWIHEKTGDCQFIVGTPREYKKATDELAIELANRQMELVKLKQSVILLEGDKFYLDKRVKEWQDESLKWHKKYDELIKDNDSFSKRLLNLFKDPK